MAREDKSKWYRNMGLGSSVGLVLVVSTLIGYGLGLFLQRTFHAPEWVFIICLLLGIAAGFVEMIRIVIEISKDE